MKKVGLLVLIGILHPACERDSETSTVSWGGLTLDGPASRTAYEGESVELSGTTPSGATVSWTNSASGHSGTAAVTMSGGVLVYSFVWSASVPVVSGTNLITLSSADGGVQVVVTGIPRP